MGLAPRDFLERRGRARKASSVCTAASASAWMRRLWPGVRNAPAKAAPAPRDAIGLRCATLLDSAISQYRAASGKGGSGFRPRVAQRPANGCTFAPRSTGRQVQGVAVGKRHDQPPCVGYNGRRALAQLRRPQWPATTRQARRTLSSTTMASAIRPGASATVFQAGGAAGFIDTRFRPAPARAVLHQAHHGRQAQIRMSHRPACTTGDGAGCAGMYRRARR